MSILLQLVSTYVDHNSIKLLLLLIIIIGGGVDYNSGPYNITLLAGENSTSFNVTINNDDEMENDEEFILIINTELLPSCILNGTDITTNVTIIGNDGRFITLSQLHI